LNQPRKFKPAKIVLLLSALVVALITAEVAYRLYIRSRSFLSYTVASNSLCEFDHAFGYRYVRNAVATTLFVLHASPTHCGNVSVGPYSNLGDGVNSWEATDLKILAFGDSFTANPFSGFSWTNHLAEILRKSRDENVSVMNFGGDGYGILQMAHFANAMVKEYRPDIVIVAFIMDDLNRARFWRTMKRINGEDRLLTTTQPTSDPDLSMAEDVTMIVPKLTVEWCRSAAAEPNKRYPFLRSLHEQFRRLANDNFRAGLGSLYNVFLFHRIVHQDPFHSIRKPTHFPKMSTAEFEQDSTFVADMLALSTQHIPIYWVMLPTWDDLNAGKYVRDAQQQRLFESFTEFMKGSNKLIDVLESVGKSTEAIDRLFLLPYDRHPSEMGSRVFARAIASKVQENSEPATSWETNGRTSASSGS